MSVSRRQFLLGTAGIAVASALPVSPALFRALAEETSGATARRLSDGWEYFEGSLDGPWQVWHSAEIAAWAPVTVPHCFNHYDACDPDTPPYRGPGWYRTHLQLANPFANGRTLLHFEGAGQTTDIYLGDQHLAQHVGGYDEFMVDVTDTADAFIDAQKNAPREVAKASAAKEESRGLPLAIRCHNGRDLERMPSDLSDFTLYGGLYRHVTVIYVPAVSLEAVHIYVEPGKPGEAAAVTVRARLYSPAGDASGASLAVEVLDPEGRSIARKSTPWSAAPASGTAFDGERTVAQATLEHPRRWSPANPILYQCRVTLTGPNGTHTVTERFGVRSTEFIEDGPFHLNGEHLLLRGTHRHEDHADYAAAMPDNLIRQEMQLIKEMGANFIRLAHYQQSRLVLDLCDELGLLVWEEVPWCRSGIGGDRFQQMGRDKLHTMIDQHFNHPSVVLWGLGNEDDWPTEYPSIDKPAIRTYMQELRDLSHKLDPTRLTSFRRCDFARDIPDVYSPSIWAGWYSGTYTEYEKSLDTQRKRVKRLIHIEWGADSLAGRHAENPYLGLGGVVTEHGTAERGLAYLPSGGEARVSRDGDWSETYACDLFDWHLKTQETLPWLTGSAQWVFKDFTTPLRPENPIPRINQKGLIQRDMTFKEGYFVFQSFWAEKPMVHLYGHTWPVRWGKPGELRMVRVYSNCMSAELFLNGHSVGVKHRNSQDFPCAGLRWSIAFQPGRNHLRVVAKGKDGSSLSDELDFTYQTEVWEKPARLTLKEISRAAGKITVLATALDEHGILCLDARTPVRFTVAGQGKLLDNRGTASGSRLVQLANGRAQISLEGGRGTCTVAVSAEGLPSAFCSLNP